MQTRHRVPTVFTLYMVDVLCCALGCVILLWFLKLHEAKRHVREAERQEKAARQTSDLLTSTRSELDETNRTLAGLRGRLLAVEKERDQVRLDRDSLLARAGALEKERDQV